MHLLSLPDEVLGRILSLIHLTIDFRLRSISLGSLLQISSFSNYILEVEGNAMDPAESIKELRLGIGPWIDDWKVERLMGKGGTRAMFDDDDSCSDDEEDTPLHQSARSDYYHLLPGDSVRYLFGLQPRSSHFTSFLARAKSLPFEPPSPRRTRWDDDYNSDTSSEEKGNRPWSEQSYSSSKDRKETPSSGHSKDIDNEEEVSSGDYEFDEEEDESCDKELLS